jgi:hypothetical protein
VRSARLLAANKRELGQAELIAGIIHKGVESGTDPLPEAKSEWHALVPEPFPWTEAEFHAAVATLIALADDYTQTGKVDVTWPTHLISPVPPAAPTHPRGRRGRV